ncbi:MAG: VapC toxin family PIN domain ribonuclease [Rhizobiales bacterium 65-79]|jgi:predicted nucleic acid-binding protein|nr:MAG: VapC toxin family PIN domain ribonuclease [Rhizobiales bacterium 65-79]
MYLLDTNVVSELRVPRRADPQLLAWTERQDETRSFLSVMTILEIQYGALLLERRDARAGKILRRWVEESVLPKFADRILPATVEIAFACARLHIPDRRGERDAWIAATALAHNLTVVTRNIKDFSGTGVKLLNPWLPASG